MDGKILVLILAVERVKVFGFFECIVVFVFVGGDIPLCPERKIQFVVGGVFAVFGGDFDHIDPFGKPLERDLFAAAPDGNGFSQHLVAFGIIKIKVEVAELRIKGQSDLVGGSSLAVESEREKVLITGECDGGIDGNIAFQSAQMVFFAGCVPLFVWIVENGEHGQMGIEGVGVGFPFGAVDFEVVSTCGKASERKEFIICDAVCVVHQIALSVVEVYFQIPCPLLEVDTDEI